MFFWECFPKIKVLLFSLTARLTQWVRVPRPCTPSTETPIWSAPNPALVGRPVAWRGEGAVPPRRGRWGVIQATSLIAGSPPRSPVPALNLCSRCSESWSRPGEWAQVPPCLWNEEIGGPVSQTLTSQELKDYSGNRGRCWWSWGQSLPLLTPHPAALPSTLGL